MKVIQFDSTYENPYPLQVVGEASYRDEIESIFGYVDETEGVDDDYFLARLILEDDNKNDPGNAVRVEIEGRTVGYLSKPNAKLYREQLQKSGLENVIGECHASIKGGFIKRDEELADFGVRLDMDIQSLGYHITPTLKTSASTPRVKKTTASPPPKNKTKTKSKYKIPFIPMNGKGVLYFLFVLPVVLSLNMIILIVAGMVFAVMWIADLLSKKDTK
jgi:hypothetical protein